MRIRVLLTVALAAAPAFAADSTAVAEPAAAATPTIATLMARDFVGTPPEGPRFSPDGRVLYYERRRPQSSIRELFRVELASGKTTRVDAAARGAVDPADSVRSRDGRIEAFVREGDVFYRDARGTLHQVTRTAEGELQPLVLLDGRIAFRRGDDFLAFDPATATTATLARLELADDPDDEWSTPAESFLERQQLRYFEYLRERERTRDEERSHERDRRAADPTRAPEPWYLGEDLSLREAALAPDGRRLAVVLGPERDRSEDDEQGADGGEADRMAVFVTENGYVDVREVRPKVGTGDPESPALALLDLERRFRVDVDSSSLPGLDEDPLAELKARAAAERPAGERDDDEAPATGEESARVVSLETLAWSADGARLAAQYFSYDNKDRWLAVVEADGSDFRVVDRLHDPAWVGWSFNEFGWLPDGETLWLLSEESGSSHLYLRPLAGERRALTAGEFEVSDVHPSRDGAVFFAIANREHPGIEEVYRIDAATGAMTRLTELGGQLDGFVLSDDERQLAFLGSSITRPTELYHRPLAGRGGTRQLTDTVAPEFAAVDWAVPEIVAVPSSHGAGEVWARVYTPADWTPEKRWPAVAFVHGAGYLQNVHYGFSSYYREFMFHTLLTRRGYVVIDMDYRGSSGYGREWRTAIYRRMGWPEVEDYRDGVAWLVANRSVDPARVGVYGGSYGGFFTFMAMFTQPDLFAAGAALRPVTDWAHYNHGYTSNILNTPEVDPEAYRKSSPIEYAEGLEKPLLICHGMADDNVAFQDTVRLVQRLIELGKTEYFETAIYPVEAHSFKQPSSWTDEYTRIWRLFERTLQRD